MSFDVRERIVGGYPNRWQAKHAYAFHNAEETDYVWRIEERDDELFWVVGTLILPDESLLVDSGPDLAGDQRILEDTESYYALRGEE